MEPTESPANDEAPPHDEEAFWRLAAEIDGLLLGSDGELRFTSKRRAELTSYFGFAGIDIRRITTRDDYLRARDTAAPFLQAWLENIAGRGEMTLERRLLLAVVRGDANEISATREAIRRARRVETDDGS